MLVNAEGNTVDADDPVLATPGHLQPQCWLKCLKKLWCIHLGISPPAIIAITCFVRLQPESAATSKIIPIVHLNTDRILRDEKIFHCIYLHDFGGVT